MNLFTIFRVKKKTAPPPTPQAADPLDEVSWACFLDPNCPGLSAIPYGEKYRWCPACVDEQPRTKAQVEAHHKNNPVFYGAILPYAPFRV